MLAQTINDIIFEDLRTHYTASFAGGGGKKSKNPLSSWQENVFRYAIGFIAHILIKRFNARKDKKYTIFVDCLLDMLVNKKADDVEESFLEYTILWTDTVNRGPMINRSPFTLNFSQHC
jgi:hypothetical protein